MTKGKSTDTGVTESSRPHAVRCANCGEVLHFMDTVVWARDSEARYVHGEDPNFLLCTYCFDDNPELYEVLATLSLLKSGV